MSLDFFHPAVARWFKTRFPAGPTHPQILAWPSIRSGRHTLVAAPTGSGKTLSAFLSTIDDLVRQGLDSTLPDETQVVYVSPLKALSSDIQKNLQDPLLGIQEELRKEGLPAPSLRVLVRTGDTPQAERTAMTKRPPHIVVTTPESLYILLTSEGGRSMLRTTRTVIVDEIHALVGNKRGSHLALSLERLESLTERSLIRVGLSATQRPIEEVARFLVGGGGLLPEGSADCTIVDAGHTRRLDLAIEVPRSPLQAVMSLEVWQEVYDRLADLIREHRTTLVFVNTRRLAERAARHLSERLGSDNVTSHHGSLSRDQRLSAEQRLKAGTLRALVATASLELGIDIGSVDLVCQIGTTRSISTWLQRAGRSGHQVGGFPKGRLFPLTRDELVECAAILDAVRRGELDRISVPGKPLDILAQQLVAAVASQEWSEEDLFRMVTRAYPYRDLSREDFDAVITMLAQGFTTKRGRRSAYLHHDAVHRRLRPRRGARLAAITSGGAIPDNADYQVVLEPTGLVIGSLNEDFAIESLAGDIFQLGNSSWKILRVEPGKVRVEDARGAPPSIPFWIGEAPSRTHELSLSLSRLREEVGELIAPVGSGQSDGSSPKAVSHPPADRGAQSSSSPSEGSQGSMTRPAPSPDPSSTRSFGDEAGAPVDTFRETQSAALALLEDQIGIAPGAAEQIVDYLAGARAALGALPSLDTIVLERFFDETGGMQLVLHAPFGGRINRAWGLALRKRFCRKFNFELQAAATEDAVVLSLGPAHSFPLDEVFQYLRSETVKDVLVQAMLDAPMFGIRWRWNAGRALAVPRWRGGRKVPPQLQRIEAEDLLALVFPDQLACLQDKGGGGEREIPDHPLVEQTIRDCLEEAMDIHGLEAILRRIEKGKMRLVACDLTEPSPLAYEILTAKPYAFLDDAPLEERRTQAVMTRRWLDPETAADLGTLDAAAIERVRAEAWPQVQSADELHDALVVLGFLTADEGARGPRAPIVAAPIAGEMRSDSPPSESGWPASHPESRAIDDSAGPGDFASSGLDQAAPTTPASGWEPFLSELIADRRATILVPRKGDARLWVSAERLREVGAIHPDARLQPPIAVPEKLGSEPTPSPDEALTEIVRARLDGLGPCTASALAAAAGIDRLEVDVALARLESEGFIMRGRFTPGSKSSDDPEWCTRRLLARIHRYTLDRLRREIEPVVAADFIRFLVDWQGAGENPPEGIESVARALDQLEGFEAPAAAWEGEILPLRISNYDPAWIDAQCLTGRSAWARRSPPGTVRDESTAPATRRLGAGLNGGAPRRIHPPQERGLTERDPLAIGANAPAETETEEGCPPLLNGSAEASDRAESPQSSPGSPTSGASIPEERSWGSSRSRGTGPVRSTPIAILQRKNLSTWLRTKSPVDGSCLRTEARAVHEWLDERGASFFDEIVEGTGLLRPQVEEAIGELVAQGLVTSDSFSGLRALLVPSERRSSPNAARRRRLLAPFSMESAGRWTLLTPSRSEPQKEIETIAKVLLRRWGVVFRRVLDREGSLPPWRDLLRVYRRLEARGEIRGGRFVAGFAGEQFALPEAVAKLRSVRRQSPTQTLVSVSAADPLNLIGILTPGGRVPALSSNRVLYRDGEPIAVREAGKVRYLVALETAEEWRLRKALLRRGTAPRLRAYLGSTA